MTRPGDMPARRHRAGVKPSDLPVHQQRVRMDPLPGLNRMSERTPLVEDDGPGINDWVATGREEVRAILADTERFSTRPPADSDEDSRRLTQTGNPLQYDPPEHTRIHKMLRPEFTVRRLRRLEPVIDKIVADRLDILERAGQPADLMRHFAWPVPGLVGCSLLGIPRDDQPELARSMDLSRRTDRPRKLVLAAANAFDGYLKRFVARKRQDPSADDLISSLIRDHGDDVDDKELVGFCASLLAAGLENMAGMLGLGVLALLEHPDQLALLRKEPDRMDQAVEEMLRYITVVPIASPRTALVDVPLAGRVIKAGQIVSCSLLAVNRTADDGFDITRDSDTTHMAFGHGVHFCTGAALARMEMRAALTALLDRFPGLRLAVPPEDLRFRPLTLAAYGVEQLPLAW